jgi:choline monooxygenase
MTSAAINAKGIVDHLTQPAAEAYGLPAATYTDPAILTLEHQKLFEKGWIGTIAAQRLRKPGDVHPITVAGRPLLVVRDRDHQIRVFHNVCRHRGLKLVDAPAHTPGIITCMYHCWSYSLDGSLKGTPYFDGTAKTAPPEAIKSQLGLIPVRSTVWFDTVFVNISGDAPPFEQFIAPLAERWNGFSLSELQLADSSGFDVQANWKFAAENFLDLYHLPWVHAQLGGPEQAFHSEPIQLEEDFLGYCMPKFDAARAETGPTMPLFSSLPKKFEFALDLVLVFPNTGILLAPSWAQVIIMHPESPSLTKETLNAYLIGEELLKPENDEARNGFVGYLHEVNNQDMRILAAMQDGRRGGNATDTGRFAPLWDGLGISLARRVARAY